jgi:predicted HTH transcriptional regulator
MSERKTPAGDVGKLDLKALRQERRELVEAARARLKTQSKETALIKKALAQGPASAPELARRTGLDSQKALYYLVSLLKYGQVREEAPDGACFRCGLKPAEEE